ncbi:MAG: hypothetical protein WA160_14930 [Pseudobdellovibrio sp.]
MRNLTLLFAFSSLVLGSCNYRESKVADKTAAPSVVFSDQTTIDATTIQESVLNTCIRCHSGTTQPNLSSIGGITASIAKINTEVTTNAMPPASSGYSPLTDCQKAILQDWVVAGMPSTSTKKVVDLAACHQGSLTPPTEIPILNMPLNYQTLTAKILQPRCLHCHNVDSGDPDAADILLFPYSKLIAHKNLLGSDSTSSKFFTIISRTDEERMPPPEDSESLTADEQEFIKRWINAGHPEK